MTKATGANTEPVRFRHDSSQKGGSVETLESLREAAAPKDTCVTTRITYNITNEDDQMPELIDEIDDDMIPEFPETVENLVYIDEPVIHDTTVFMVGGGQTYPAEITASVNGVRTMALIDTGATVSLVSENILIRSGGRITRPYLDDPIRTANSQTINIVGFADIEIRIGTAIVDCTIPVVHDLARNLIIGKDMLKTMGAKLDMLNDTISFLGCPPITFAKTKNEVFSLENDPSIYTVYAAKEITIQARTEMTLELDIHPKIRTMGDVAVITGNKDEVEPAYHVGNAFIDLKANTIFGIVANVTQKPIIIAAGEIIGEITPFWAAQIEDKTGTKPTITHTSKFQPEDIQLGDTLSEPQRQIVYQLLQEFEDVFAETLTEPGKLKVAPATIDIIPGATITNTRNYRRSEKEHDQIKEIMDDKLAKKVAEPSFSPYASPLILVPKKTGGLRMCVDLRKLNKVTITQTFPMPRPDDLFTTVRGSVLFSLADATWGYWQINLNETDREKAAYMTREGLYQPTTMDFGMKNAPIIWQRAMHLVFQGLLWEICVIYIDDLLIFSKTFEEHLRNMRQCLSRCREYNLKLRPSKCEFFRTRINFLGHVISGEGVEVSRAKVDKILDIPAPDTQAKLNSFVCLVAYYREFIRNFAAEAHVLRELVKAKIFKWEEIHQQAFEKLKRLLLESAMLHHPDTKKPFILECDASDVGIGYILAQEDVDGKNRVIAFGSRALNPREQNFSATERECLAIVEGVKKYHIYLHGNEFVIKTDHKALVWLMNHTDHTSKLMRWALKLQEYRFTILHREGRNNANADAMSRLVNAEPRHKKIAFLTETTIIHGEQENGPVTTSFASPEISNAPQIISNAPQIISNAPLIISNAPEISNAPQIISDATQILLNAPEIWNVPRIISTAPQLISNTTETEGASQIFSNVTNDISDTTHASSGAPMAFTLEKSEDSNLEEISKAQWNDKKLKRYIKYLRHEKLPKNKTKALEVMGQCQTLELFEGILYHIWSPRDSRHRDDDRRQVAIPNGWHDRVLKECHDSNLTGGHLGFTKTHHKIRERYWWPGMYSEVKEYLKTCIDCQKRKGAQPKNAGVVQAIVANDPWEHVGMDIFGPLPATIRGNRYIITFTDFVTKYVEGAVLTEATENATANVLVDLVICRHGVMEKLTSDRGSNFVANAITQLYKILEIRKINTTAWHPQGNGQTERFNQPLADMLAIYTNGKHKEWDRYFFGTLFAYNISIHEATKYSPFFLVYGREPRFPLEIAMGTADREPIGGTAALAEEMAHKLKTAFANARRNIQEAQHKMEIRAAETHRKHNFKIGDKVWLFVKKRTDNKMVAKLKFPWQGPFEITKIVTPNVIALRRRRGLRLGQNVHVNRLKHYFERRPNEEPILDIEDDFDLEEEGKAIETTTLVEGEQQPEEEVGVNRITDHNLRGDRIYFTVKWVDGDITWEEEENLENCAALDDYYRSKHNDPFFGLLLQLKKLDVLFRKRFATEVAKDIMIKLVREFCLESIARGDLIREVQSKGSMGELRSYLTNFITKFRYKMDKLKPTYIAKLTNRKRTHGEVFMLEIRTNQTEPTQEEIDDWRAEQNEIRREQLEEIIEESTLGNNYNNRITNLLNQNLIMNQSLVIFHDTINCERCEEPLITDDWIYALGAKGAKWCYKCCEYKMWRQRFKLVHVMSKFLGSEQFTTKAIDIIMLERRYPDFRLYIRQQQESATEFDDMQQEHFYFDAKEVFKRAAILADHKFPYYENAHPFLKFNRLVRNRILKFLDTCYSCHMTLAENDMGESFTFNNTERSRSAVLCVNCKKTTIKISDFMHIGMFEEKGGRCINHWANKKGHPVLDTIIPSLGIIVERRKPTGRIFQDELTAFERKMYELACQEIGERLDLRIIRDQGALHDVRQVWPKPYSEAFDYIENSDKWRSSYLCTSHKNRICAACNINFTSCEREYWDGETKYYEIPGENLCLTCVRNTLWIERAFDVDNTCGTREQQLATLVLFFKGGRLFTLLNIVMKNNSKLARILYFWAMGPTKLIGEGDTHRVVDFKVTTDRCILCGMNSHNTKMISVVPWMDDLFGVCGKCMKSALIPVAKQLQIQMYDAPGSPILTAEGWDAWRMGLMWSHRKRVIDQWGAASHTK